MTEIFLKHISPAPTDDTPPPVHRKAADVPAMVPLENVANKSLHDDVLALLEQPEVQQQVFSLMVGGGFLNLLASHIAGIIVKDNDVERVTRFKA